MKKNRLFLVALAALFVFSSCDFSTKSCRCYQLSGSRWTGPNTQTTAAGRNCNSLNTSTLLCNEMDDPILDPDDIAVGKK